MTLTFLLRLSVFWFAICTAALTFRRCFLVVTAAAGLLGIAASEAVAAGTRAAKPLYSLSINPSAPLSRAQYMAAIDHIEDRLGLTGQPRAIVFQVKDGREHCHVIWSRIDNMKAIAISLARMKLRTCARQLAHAYGRSLPPGLAEERGDAIKLLAAPPSCDRLGAAPVGPCSKRSVFGNRESALPLGCEWGL